VGRLKSPVDWTREWMLGKAAPAPVLESAKPDKPDVARVLMSKNYITVRVFHRFKTEKTLPPDADLVAKTRQIKVFAAVFLILSLADILILIFSLVAI
jgi:hypothetical protein